MTAMELDALLDQRALAGPRRDRDRSSSRLLTTTVCGRTVVQLARPAPGELVGVEGASPSGVGPGDVGRGDLVAARHGPGALRSASRLTRRRPRAGLQEVHLP